MAVKEVKYRWDFIIFHCDFFSLSYDQFHYNNWIETASLDLNRLLMIYTSVIYIVEQKLDD